MNLTLHDLEQIAARSPNRRLHSVIADLRAKEKAEQLRAPRDYAVDEEARPVSWFERLMGRAK